MKVGSVDCHLVPVSPLVGKGYVDVILNFFEKKQIELDRRVSDLHQQLVRSGWIMGCGRLYRCPCCIDGLMDWPFYFFRVMDTCSIGRSWEILDLDWTDHT